MISKNISLMLSMATILPILIQCTARVSRQTRQIITENTESDIGSSQYAPMIMEFIVALQKEQLRLKYEIGQDIYKIAQMNMNSADSAHNEGLKSAVVDSTRSFLPESVLKANDFLKLITSDHSITDEAIINGYKTLTAQVQDVFLVLVINNINIKLFRLLFDHNLINPGAHHYEVALEKVSENHSSRTDAMDEILEKLSSFDLDVKAIGKTVSEIKIGKEFNIVTAQLAIKFNNFPIFKRLLANGLKPDTRIPDVGSLLSVSVHGHCLKCTEALIAKGADVNAPIELDGMLKFNALAEQQNPFGWTPLLVAVAHGNVQMVKALVASGKAQITKASLEDKKLHSRAMARKIVDKNIRKEILKELKLCPVDQGRVAMVLDSKLMTMEQALNTNNYEIVDAVLLSGREPIQDSWIIEAISNCSLEILELLINEKIKITTAGREYRIALEKEIRCDAAKKTELVLKFLNE